MDEMDIRLECLRLATHQVNSAVSLMGAEPRREGAEIELAQEFYRFVRGYTDEPKLKAA